MTLRVGVSDNMMLQAARSLTAFLQSKMARTVHGLADVTDADKGIIRSSLFRKSLTMVRGSIHLNDLPMLACYRRFCTPPYMSVQSFGPQASDSTVKLQREHVDEVKGAPDARA